MAIATAEDDGWTTAVLHNCLGIVAVHEGHPDLAREQFSRCMAVGSERDLHRAQAVALANLAELDLLAGDHEGARARKLEVIDLHRRWGMMRTGVPALVSLAQLELHLDRHDAAAGYLAEALELVLPEDASEVATVLETCAFWAAARGMAEPAVLLSAAARAQYTALNASPEIFPFREQEEGRLAAVQATMDGPAATAAGERGSVLSIPEALAFAISTIGAGARG